MTGSTREVGVRFPVWELLTVLAQLVERRPFMNEVDGSRMSRVQAPQAVHFYDSFRKDGKIEAATALTPHQPSQHVSSVYPLHDSQEQGYDTLDD